MMLFLKEKYKELLLGIIRKSFTLPVEIWAYGSRVDGTAHEGSDLDLVIRGEGLIPLNSDIIEHFRENLRNSNIPILIEARDWARIPEYFHSQILKKHFILYPGVQAETASPH